MSTEELKVVLRRSEYSGFGFSLLGTTGPPHVIYDIVENSPAADCGAVEAGDVILKINGTDVHRYTTKEVLKCLRLSDDVVTLELKRDPKLKARIKEQLANTKGPHYLEIETYNNYNYQSSTTASTAYFTDAAKITTLPSSQFEQTHSSYQQQRNSPVTAVNCPASRYRTITQVVTAGVGTSTNISPRNQTVSSFTNHSHSSSASSAKMQMPESNTTNYAATATSQNSTSPTSRPSRIPQAVKCPQKVSPVHSSPQQKRSRPSHIPTKAGLQGITTSTSNGSSTMSTTTITTHVLQHSNSYSNCHVTESNCSTRHRSQNSEEKNAEPISAPPQPMKAPRFEAYMMTGDLILNLSRTPQNSNLLPALVKKVDSLRDSVIKPPAIVRPNGALAPKASGESSPTSSSSLESPNHTTSLSSGNLSIKDKSRLSKGLKQQLQPQPQQSLQKDSFNNSYNNRRDSLTNDTLQMCEELEEDDGGADIRGQSLIHCSQQRKHQEQRYRQQQQFVQNKQQSFDNYDHNDDEGMSADLEYDYNRQSPQPEFEDENEEDQTNYDITNLETYNSGGDGAGADDEASDRQCLMQYDGNDDEEGSTSTKQHLHTLKQKASLRYKERIHHDAVDCARTAQNSSSSSSTTVGGGTTGGEGGANTSQDETSFSVPTSPISLSTPLIDKGIPNSMPTSPEPSNIGGGAVAVDCSASGIVVVRRHNGIVRTCDSAGFRTSKSEDHLQQIQREGIAAVIPIDIDEDVNSSLNTLLDTRQDSEDSQASNRDRIVWTYNAPLQPHQLAAIQQQHEQHQYSISSHYGHQISSNNSHHTSHSSSISSSPQNSVGSPVSPTSVSSSVMSSSGSKGPLGVNSINCTHNNGHTQPQHHQNFIASNGGVTTSTNAVGTVAINLGLLQYPNSNNSGVDGGSLNANTSGGGDHSVSEAISNISSPDYQDDDNLLSSRDLLGGMILSDPSDSDSTILVSDAAVQRQQHHQRQKQQKSSEHKVVIQVRGADTLNSNNNNNNNTNNNNNNNNNNNQGSSPKSLFAELKDSEDELGALMTAVSGPCNLMGNNNVTLPSGDNRDSSPPISDDGSDVESLHSYHYSPKAVDMPSAIRLAKRLHSLDGFKKSDVSRHLSKNNDFSRAVADEYLKYFNFEQKTLDQSLREFLLQFSLSGETQERERVLVHFSKRYLDCNRGSFNSQDAVHTLTCAIMLLNTDLHGQNIGRKMTCGEFIENLAELNDGDNFPKEVLKYLYQAIKTQPLDWALDDDVLELQKQLADNKQTLSGSGSNIGQNPFLDLPESSTAVEYKKGYVMRKCCYDVNYKKTPFGKRSWKMFYCTLRDLVLYLHKDEHGFRKSQMSDNLHNAIRIHHALATKASDYTKKQHVFRLQTADQAEYLFQTSDSKELQSWVETINFVCAAYSAPSLEAGVGSQKRFQRPLLPSTHTKLLMKDQLEAHEKLLAQLENSLMEHRKGSIPNKGLALQNYKDKEGYLQYELRRYKAYVSILSIKVSADQQQLELQQNQQQQSCQLNEEADEFPKRLAMQSSSSSALTSNTNSIINSPTQQLQQPSATQTQSRNRKKEKKK